MLPTTVVDAHLHVWDFDRADYPWLGPQYGALNRTIELSEVQPRMAAAGVGRAILVQAADNAEDTRHMLGVAAHHKNIAGVVGWVPLDRPDEAATMLAELPREVVGIRNLIHDQPDPDWILRTEVGKALDLVAGTGLPFDYVAVLPRHLEHLPTLRRRHPELRIVIDHLGKPPVGQADPQPWSSLIAQAAALPEVYAKVSGLYPTAGDPHVWNAADLRPILHHALDLFGAQRLMFGTDWPISETAGGYDTIWQALRTVIGELSEPEQDWIWRHTAETCYRIDP